ncbi:hypothetical protein glysoja_012196 [Glycine soja]|nr:hypothetical protein glysoja_012196 [Glycine soja]
MLVSDFVARCLLCNDGNRSSNAASVPIPDSSDAHQPNEEICCSDYQFVFMGVKGVIIGFINSSSRAMHIRLFCTSLYREMKNPPVTSFFQLFWQDLGLLFMLMFLGPIASKQMSVERIDGFF